MGLDTALNTLWQLWGDWPACKMGACRLISAAVMRRAVGFIVLRGVGGGLARGRAAS